MKALSLIFVLIAFSFAVSAQNSHIQVVAEPGITVLLDGQFKGVTSSDYNGLIIQNVSSGQHLIKVIKEGYSPREETVTVKAGEVLLYQVDANFASAIKITEEGNKEKQTISIKKGNLTIQSLPVSINIQIPRLGVDYMKQQDKFHAENIPEGTYLTQFRWNEKVLNDSIKILNEMVTSLFVNMVELKVESKDYKNIEEQEPLQEARVRVSGALSNTQNTGTAGQNQGAAGGTGNQGVESGTIDATTSGAGSGSGTNGISYDLGDRKAQSLYKPPYDIRKDGIVVVAVTVDRSGRVTEATPGIKGSTTLDENLIKLAKDAALKTRFESSNDAPIIQKGTITYHFKLK